jgi:hypothetical protein
MRHTIALAALLAPLAALSQVQPSTFEGVESLAKRGDYQAQRNLAFGYASLPYKGQEKNPLLACAWYLVVLHSGSPKLDEGDAGNVQVYCGRLTDTSRAASTGQARVLFSQIYKREARF